jgi:FkbM family methyltransferase
MSTYSQGLKLFRVLLRIPVLSDAITTFSRIWLRHYRWRAHLRAFQFDGVIDGGANIGEFAHLVRETLPQAHLICVEPHPDCASHLKQKGFEVVQAALWSERTTLNLFQNGPTTSSTVMPDATGGRQVAQVDAVRLCDLEIRGERLLIKLDLQGAEMSALHGLGDLEKRCAGFLLEVSLPPGGTFTEINQFLASKNYVLFASVNELFSTDRQIEADMLWINQRVL